MVRNGEGGREEALRQARHQHRLGDALSPRETAAHEHDAHGVLEVLDPQTAQRQPRLERVAVVADALVALQ